MVPILFAMAFGGNVASTTMKYRAAKTAAGQAVAQGIYDEAAALKEADAIRAQSEQEATKIRAAALSYRSTAIAVAAANGVVFGDGTTQAMVDEAHRLAEQDVFVTLYDGQQGTAAKKEQARMARMQGDMQSKAYQKQAQATVIEGATDTAKLIYGMK